MAWVKLQAPAKVNLALDVQQKREDGYHELRTIMQTVDLYNTVRVALSHSSDTYLYSDNADVPCDCRNLAWKAAQHFFQAVEMEPKGLDISLEKGIPMQAGMAGGSTDAAATLVGLNELFGLGLTTERLCEIGKGVGADVPFCIRGGLQLCTGIGEQFTQLTPLPEGCWILVGKPAESMETPQAFSMLDAADSVRHPDPDALAGALECGSLARIGAQMRNVFEDVIDVPSVVRIRQVLLEGGAAGACMTGSGTAVIGLFGDKRTAWRCSNRLKGVCQSVFLTQPIPHGVTVLGKDC